MPNNHYLESRQWDYDMEMERERLERAMWGEYDEDRTATMGEADREFAHNVGAQQPHSAWILSDRDVWYQNPAYVGPAVPHPESDFDDDIPF
jgi:hypothetical protein